MIPQVIEALQRAFGTQEIRSDLQEKNGRVFGFVTITGSDQFDRMDDIRRQAALWKQLGEVLGSQATQVGPIVLEPIKRG